MKKGFTLVELLAVVAILAIIATISIVSFNTIKTRNDKRNIQVLEEEIKNAAITYAQDYSLFHDNNESLDVNYKTLVEYGYIDANLINPSTNQKYTNCTYVTVSYNSNTMNYSASFHSSTKDNCEADSIQGSVLDYCDEADIIEISLNKNHTDAKLRPTSVKTCKGDIYGSIITKFKPSLKGYTFLGWYDDRKEGNRKNATDPITATTLYAHYIKNTENNYVTISYTCGSTTTTTQVKKGSKHIVLDNFCMLQAGEEFEGWKTINPLTGIETIYNPGDELTINNNTSFTSNIVAPTYIVTFNDIKSASSCTSPSIWSSNKCIKYVQKGSTYGILPYFSKPGYNLEGWYTASSGGNKISSGSTVTLTTDQILYAHFNAITYNINYTLNGGTHGTYHPNSATYDTWVTISNPSYEGHVFEGWSISSGYGYYKTDKEYSINSRTVTNATQFKNLSNSSGTITLTANWKSTAMVIYDCGSGSAKEGVSLNTTVAKESTLTLPSISSYCNVPANATFSSWEVTNSSTGLSVNYSPGVGVNITGNTVIKANYVFDTYTIKFDANGGTGTMADQVLYVGSQQKLSKNKFGMRGYYFAGWSYNGKDIKFYDGEYVQIGSKDQVITLKAVWRQEAYNCDAGKYLPANSFYCNPCSAGYSCSGGTYAYSNVDQGMVACSVGTYTPSTGYSKCLSCEEGTTSDFGGTYCYVKPYRIYYELNGGHCSSSWEWNCNIGKRVYMGSQVGELPVPIKEGYIFNGWKLDGTTITSSYVWDRPYDETITADWIGEDLSIYFVDEDGPNATSEKKVKYGDAIGTLPSLTRTGYVFGGWYTTPNWEDGDKISKDTIITSSQSFYARWNRVITVIFKCNDMGGGCITGKLFKQNSDDEILGEFGGSVTFDINIKTGIETRIPNFEEPSIKSCLNPGFIKKELRYFYTRTNTYTVEGCTPTDVNGSNCLVNKISWTGGGQKDGKITIENLQGGTDNIVYVYCEKWDT